MGNNNELWCVYKCLPFSNDSSINYPTHQNHFFPPPLLPFTKKIRQTNCEFLNFFGVVHFAVLSRTTKNNLSMFLPRKDKIQVFVSFLRTFLRRSVFFVEQDKNNKRKKNISKKKEYFKHLPKLFFPKSNQT